jgi:hypothetical protein
MLFLWSVVSCGEMQRALQWWFQRQSAQLLSESEQIHNGVLQEVFALRRDLERSLSAGTGASTSQSQAWLQQTEQLHQSLQQLSETLTPPFLSESLPLAMQWMLQPLQASELNLQIDLPSNWQHDSAEQNRMILMLLDELLTRALADAAIDALHQIRLLAAKQYGELTVRVTYPDRQTMTALRETKELKYLYCCFQSLTPGRCLCQTENTTVMWRFRWRLPEAQSL